MNRAVLLVIVAACASRTPRAPANLYDAWIDAVAARAPDRIAALLAVSGRVYYDDDWTGVRTRACRPWAGGIHAITSPAARTELAGCIATTVTHSRALDPTHRTGELSIAELAPLVDRRVRDALAPLARDHRFVHGHSVGAGEYDFTLAIARTSAEVDFVALTVVNGD